VADCSFAKKSRLLNAGDYKAVFVNAQYKASCRHFLVLAVNNGSLSARLGLVIAKKNVSLAVQRNRIKRRIRDSFRLNSALLSSLDLVVLARKDADTLSNVQVNETIEALWHKLEIKRKQATATQGTDGLTTNVI